MKILFTSVFVACLAFIMGGWLIICQKAPEIASATLSVCCSAGFVLFVLFALYEFSKNKPH